MADRSELEYRISTSEHDALLDVIDTVPQLHADAAIACDATGPLFGTRATAADQVGYFLKSLPLPLQSLARHLQDMRSGELPLCILTGLPNTDNRAALMMVIGALSGELREYEGQGAPVVEVSDKRKVVANRPSSDNNLFFDLHTDMSFYPAPPAMVGFLMVEQGASGGESLFCDGKAVADALSEDARSALAKPFRFAAPPHEPEGAARRFPVLTVGEDSVSLRYRRDGLEPLEAGQQSALDELTEAMAANRFQATLSTGEMAVYSNRTMLHGRNAYADDGRGPRRSALRAYFDAGPGAAAFTR